MIGGGHVPPVQISLFAKETQGLPFLEQRGMTIVSFLTVSPTGIIWTTQLNHFHQYRALRTISIILFAPKGTVVLEYMILLALNY